ncbi:MAG: ABC-type sugar transport system, permease component [Clostridia bacterium]|jgi:raffinose/stachyose/melibiose transport system permease protein|uniref:carbohydrate ABC transporter permease n=1 Tax=Petroclostridium xylanilyticum TaxID=1792311 RepID=UPI000B98747B|nr:carbohydrate ABC transporter permease [Petroclostridium xylanilyticum]MBZ4644571.1 ABC-type sugar transport system, permease component [Clostridia bacterium]
MKHSLIIKKILGFLLNIVMMLFSFTCIFPLIWMMYSSLKTQKEFSLNIISMPLKPQFDNYIQAIKVGKMQIYFFNSLFISIISVIGIIIIAFITGYFLSRYQFRGRNFLYVFFLSGMLIPIHSLLIPVFIQFKWLGFLDKRFTLILPYIAFGLPMAVFLLESFIKSIPVEIEEAAVIDGSPIFTTLMRIILPICRPVISTVLILSFLNAWNEFPFALILVKSQKLKTLPVGLTNFNGQYSVNYTQLMAALVIAVLPVIIIYLLFYKKIIQGMTAGAVKG